ncbi:39S ribosomal protein L16, mitochondrial [Malassezia yamatoensis]|uniref:39S ribosomal protein L16, mitochondrial n=1 Tax=Malassezia yamatoensis TaxID=253288 RepID=A0AAJ5YV71_9BASI|nr:39S ribosomal protein L16, mitochondrial [Malassezia yamatoensis]
MSQIVLPSFPTVQIDQRRWASNLGPRRTKYRKSQKGRVPFPLGGSVKGTTVSQGIYGLRTLQPCRLSAMQLSAAETVLKRKLKVVRGSQVFMRVFPDVPVCVKGNETRMGKGKGTFEFWACRVPVGRVLFEIGGHVEVRPEVAKEGTLNESHLALRLAAAKLPIRTEFITASTPPRLGREVDVNLASALPSIKAES